MKCFFQICVKLCRMLNWYLGVASTNQISVAFDFNSAYFQTKFFYFLMILDL